MSVYIARRQGGNKKEIEVNDFCLDLLWNGSNK